MVAPHVERSLAGLALTGPGARGTEAAEDFRAPQPGGRRHQTERKISFEGAPGTWALMQSLISHPIKFLDGFHGFLPLCGRQSYPFGTERREGRNCFFLRAELGSPKSLPFV